MVLFLLKSIHSLPIYKGPLEKLILIDFQTATWNQPTLSTATQGVTLSSCDVLRLSPPFGKNVVGVAGT